MQRKREYQLMFDAYTIRSILQRPGCLIAIIVATFFVGGIATLAAYGLLVTVPSTPEPTLVTDGCYIQLNVTHDLYDTREDYWQEKFPIGELEPDTYGVIGVSDELIAIDWRGDINIHPPTLDLIDWIYPKEGINNILGDCDNVEYFPSIVPTLTAVP